MGVAPRVLRRGVRRRKPWQHCSGGPPDLEQLVKEADLAGREPAGKVGAFLALVAAAWSVFQVWYASPLAFVVGFGIFNDTEARAIHLAFAMFLAFAAFPAFRSSSRKVVPWTDWALALDRRVLRRLSLPLLQRARDAARTADRFDMAVGLVGVAIMLEATRRAMGMGC